MKRRDFLKYSAPLSLSPLFLNGMPVKTFATPSMLSLVNCAEAADRVIVLVFLKGGNDGINTIIPVDQHDTYMGHRPTIGLPESGSGAFINLDTTLPLADQVGIHPSMTAFKTMYENGKATLIQGVGYPSANKSHFKSTDLWLSAGDGTPANFNFVTGWMGRYLDAQYPGLIGNPTTANPDPLGIQLGDTKPSLGFLAPNDQPSAINLTNNSPDGFYNLVQSIGTVGHNSLPSSEYGSEIGFVMGIENSTNVYAQRITDVFNAGGNSSTTYPSGGFAGQLKTVARLIDGGSKTKIFLTNRGGFDTHNGQIETGSPATGSHANKLADVFNSIKAFHDDLDAMNHENKVLTIVFTEFGRKVIENGNEGTDHGTLHPMFLFGPAVEPGVIGTNIDLNNLDSSGAPNNNQIQYDYRATYKSALADWLGASDSVLSAAYLNSHETLPIINNPCNLNAFLPIVLINFDAQPVDNREVLLTWRTEGEYNHDYFEIERSEDGENFETILRVDGDYVNTTSIRNYNETDYEPYIGTSYYRLKSVDLDGKFSYSATRVVVIENEVLTHVKVYPNPARFDAQIVMTSDKSLEAKVNVISAAGMIHQVRRIQVKKGFNKFTIDVSNLSSGNYIVQIESDNKRLVDSMQLLVAR